MRCIECVCFDLDAAGVQSVDNASNKDDWNLGIRAKQVGSGGNKHGCDFDLLGFAILVVVIVVETHLCLTRWKLNEVSLLFCECQCCSPIGPATGEASSKLAMHRRCCFGINHFFKLSAVACAFIACSLLSHRKSKLQACNAPRVQFWHRPFFSNFSAVSKWMLLCAYRLCLALQ